MTPAEPRNPLYLLLLLASLLFTVTAVAYAVVPVLENKAAAGQVVPPTALRTNGGTWLLCELAAVAVLAIASMWLDHRRSLKKERAAGTIAPVDDGQPTTAER
jgi:hypothetical protein